MRAGGLFFVFSPICLFSSPSWFLYHTLYMLLVAQSGSLFSIIMRFFFSDKKTWEANY